MLKKILITSFVVASLSLFYVVAVNAQTAPSLGIQGVSFTATNTTSHDGNDNEGSNNENENSNNSEGSQSNNVESNTGNFMSASTMAMINSCIAKGDKVVYGGNAVGANTAPVCISHFQRQAQLTITPSGRFLARGMVIKSISSSTNSFIGEVWGTTWTIYSSGTKYFILSNGTEKNANNVIPQLRVGEEVGVSGFIDKGNPGVVKARVVRNYNLNSERYQEREREFENERSHIRSHVEGRFQQKGFQLEKETHNNNEFHNGNNSMKGRVTNIGVGNGNRRNMVATQIQNILKQIEAIKAQIQTQKQAQ